MQRDVKALIEGGISGVLGTLSMSTVMLAARRAGLMGQLPPERITEAALDAAGQGRSKEVQDALAVILHLLFGAFAGSFFGLLRRRLRVPRGRALQGIGYGLLVWAVSYKGWIPALGILPPPERDRPDRPLIMALAHVVYGWTTAAVVDARERRGMPRAGDSMDAAPDAPVRRFAPWAKGRQSDAHDGALRSRQDVAVRRDGHAGLLGQQNLPNGLGRLALGGGVALALTGGVLLYRRARKPVSSSGTSDALVVERTITIGASADALYQGLRQPQTLAQIVGPFATVTPLDANRTRWTVSGPLGRRFDWETQVVESRPGELLRWESQAGAPVPNRGTVTFRPAPANRGTEVVLRIDIDPPGGMLGVASAQRFGVVPALYAAKALRRFKSLIEAGEIPTTAHQPAARGDGRDE